MIMIVGREDKKEVTRRRPTRTYRSKEHHPKKSPPPETTVIYDFSCQQSIHLGHQSNPTFSKVIPLTYVSVVLVDIHERSEASVSTRRGLEPLGVVCLLEVPGLPMPITCGEDFRGAEAERKSRGRGIRRPVVRSPA